MSRRPFENCQMHTFYFNQTALSQYIPFELQFAKSDVGTLVAMRVEYLVGTHFLIFNSDIESMNSLLNILTG